MKTITFAVPCYNSQSFMKKCVDSLLAHSADDIEIVIVNDGSTDNTVEIADDYARLHAGVVKVIHQKNKGHGGAINAALAAARGLYFKVIDSDDFVDADAYARVLAELRRFAAAQSPVDVIVSNYVYEKAGRKYKKAIRYESSLPQDVVFGWESVGRLVKGQYMLMHSLIYRTELLKLSGLELPEHTFYVDNLFAYVPMSKAETLYYINADFYRYSIGVEGQSVQEQTMIKRIDQQITVNKLMLSSVDIGLIENKRQRSYLLHYLEIVTSVTLFFLMRANTPEADEKCRRLWDLVESDYPAAYRFLRRGLISSRLRRPGRARRAMAVVLYKAAKKVYGFN